MLHATLHCSLAVEPPCTLRQGREVKGHGDRDDGTSGAAGWGAARSIYNFTRQWGNEGAPHHENRVFSVIEQIAEDRGGHLSTRCSRAGSGKVRHWLLFWSAQATGTAQSQVRARHVLAETSLGSRLR